MDSTVFNKRLLEIANEYLEYELVDPRTKFAPTMCITAPQPRVTFSQSDDTQSHGKKLYLLFASDLKSYLVCDEEPSPVGQVIVKESWGAVHQEQVPDGWLPDANHRSGESFIRQAWDNGKRYVVGEQKELFIMYKLAPDTEATDNGWVYGVVAADGNHVVESGKIKNCMSCHLDAGKDRLFGLEKPRRGGGL